ncbi:MAG: hypothetical protein M3Y81_00055 [Chloroflexota bacterium]|nr:hypothetical protein [Chloroflexota bacterium]
MGEQTKTQELLAILQTRSWTKNEALPMWLKAIAEDESGIAVWQPKTRLPHEEQQDIESR